MCSSLLLLLLLSVVSLVVVADNTLYRLIQELTDSCLDPSVEDKSQVFRDLVQKHQLQCSGEAPTAQVRVLVPTTAHLSFLMRKAEEYRQLTGTKVVMTVVKFTETVHEIVHELTFNMTRHDGWIYDPAGISDAMRVGALEDMQEFIDNDAQIAWQDITRFVRESTAMYKGQVVGIPLDGDVQLLYYRKDVMSALNLTVPDTWNELLEVVRAANGTNVAGNGRPFYGMCINKLPLCTGSFNLLSILAPYLQYQGTRQGVFMDPQTGQLLLDNPAVEAALKILRALTPYGPPEDHLTCASAHPRFLLGDCFMTMGWGDMFKMASKSNSSRIKGKLGTMLLPGSTHVYNRGTRHLEPCTGGLCPFATPAMVNGQPALVNRAPFHAFGGWVGGVSRRSQQKLATYRFLSYLSSPEVSWEAVLDPSTGVDPYRLQMMDESAVPRWTAAGYDESDTRHFLQVIREAMDNRNGVLDIRTPGGTQVRLAFDLAAMNASKGGDIQQVMSVMKAGIQEKLRLTQLTKWELLDFYRYSLGYTEQAEHPRNPPFWWKYVLGAAGAMVIVVAVCWALFLVYKYHKLHYRSWLGKLLPPGKGVEATILVSDIQGSTCLWELLPPDVMDRAINIHHECIRRHLLVHHGYEVATEGDSFIIAFHSPTHALQFALDVQEDLLKEDWPCELTELEACKPVYLNEALSLHLRAKRSITNEDSTAINVLISPGSTCPRPSTSGAKLSGEVDQGLELVEGSTPSSSTPTNPGGGLVFLDSLTYHEAVKSSWLTCMSPSPTSQLVFRGLRIRMGMHTHTLGEDDVAYNKSTARMMYAGPCLSTARSIVDLCEAGVVMMSEVTFSRLPMEQLSKKCLVLHGGEVRVREGGASVDIFCAFSHSLHARLSQMDPLRSAIRISPGVLEAPLGHVAVVFTYVVGASTLLAWNQQVARTSFDIFKHQATELLARFEGYLVESVDGLLLSSFKDTASALIWGLKLRSALMMAEWPELLLSHELGEEVVVGTDAPSGLQDESPSALGSGPINAMLSHDMLLYRGLRLKLGIDVGQVSGEVHPLTGRMSYRGRVMNRAARIASVAGTGQVYCSGAVWSFAEGDDKLKGMGISGLSLGEQKLKGISSPVLLYHVRFRNDGTKSKSNSLASYRSSVSLTPFLRHTRSIGNNIQEEAVEEEGWQGMTGDLQSMVDLHGLPLVSSTNSSSGYRASYPSTPRSPSMASPRTFMRTSATLRGPTVEETD